MALRPKFKWFLGILAMLALLAVAIVINFTAANHDATKIIGAIDSDHGNQKINWDRYPTFEIELSESLNITEAGTYHLTGELEDGLITVDIENTVARLILDNVKIKNSSGPAIICNAGEDLVIEFIGENTLEDSTSYLITYDEDITGVIYSKADLSFGGTGDLNIIANHQDAIIGKDDLNFNDGSYNINAIDDGIRGRDSVYITTGNFDIKVGGEAIKSNNDLDAGKGFIVIENGKFAIDSAGKGIEATNSILIYNGNFQIQSYDDSIHSNNYVGIIDGSLTLDSGDDAMHADRELIIDGGSITVKKAYEGLEAQVITINNGTFDIATFDDSINAGGGTDSSSVNNKGMNDVFFKDESCVININGGNIYIDSDGDGIDSNGWLYINDGTISIDGPTNNGDSTLDAGAGIVMNGGEVTAFGSSGMVEEFSSSSTVYNISLYFQNTQRKGSKVEIKDSNNRVIVSHTATKNFSHLTAGSTSFMPGTYKIFVDDKEYDSFTIENIVTIIGNTHNNQMMPPQNDQNRK